MFYDERIEKAKGKIAKNAIIMSVIISAIIGALRLANVLKNTHSGMYLCFTVLEAVIVLGGLICLLIGFIRSKLYIRDERIISEESSFYNKASSVLIKVVIFVFAFFLPIVSYIGRPNNFADVGLDSILSVLFFIVGTYVIYGFRRNDIYFNYSIMEREDYYKCVFKNIGKLALYILCMFAVSVISFIIFVAAKYPDLSILIKYVLQIIALYAGALIEFSLLYLLYSFLEKTSYNSNRLISKSTVLSLGITIFIYAAYTAVMIFVYSLDISQVQAIQLVTMASSFGIYIKFALLIFLTYLGYEYQKINHNKLLSASCLTIILSETLYVFSEQISVCLLDVFIPEIVQNGAYVINQIFSAIIISIQYISDIANVVGFSLIIVALIRDKAIKKSNFIAIICFAILGGAELFLRTQVGYLEVNIYHAFTEIAVLLYFCILTVYIGRKKADEKSPNVSPLPPFDEIVEAMYDKDLSFTEGTEVIKVIYSKDKSKRFIILKSDKGFFKYVYEELCLFDEEERMYFHNNENIYAYWSPNDPSFAYSFFDTEENAFSALISEPEYKKYFE